MTSEPIRPVDSPAASDGASTPHPVIESASRAAKRTRWLMRVLPFAAIALGLGISWLLFSTRPEPIKAEPAAVVPLVRVVTAAPEDLALRVLAHGSVVPRTESDLVAEVRGRVMSVGPALVAGGFFEQGEELLRLDDREHRISVLQARATVRLRESEAKLAHAEARRGQELARRGATSAAELETMESRALVADAQLEAARAALAQSELDLDRTVVRAPFAGRVRERSVDVGQFVNPGSKLGRIQAIDAAEVHLPIPTDDLAFLDVPLTFGAAAVGTESAAGQGSPVTLTAKLSGQEVSWPARLVRTDGEIDLRTRTLNVVALVEDPYRRAAHLARAERARAESEAALAAADPAAALALPEREPPAVSAGEIARAETARRPEVVDGAPPLPSGLFVSAEIEGRTLTGVTVLPPAALRDGDRVFVVDGEDRLRVRPVEVLRHGRDRVVVGEGIADGDRVVVSPLPLWSEGMQLRTIEGETS